MTDDKLAGAASNTHLFREGLELFLDLAAVVLLVFGNKHIAKAAEGPDRREAVKQQLPNIFGFGNKDEALLASVRACLSKDERAAFDKILMKLDLDDAIPFIVNIASIKNEEGVKEFTEHDRRVLFLKKLLEDANMCATPDGVEAAINSLRANRMLDRSRFSVIQKEIEAIMLSFFKITNWNELTPLKFGKAMNSIADSIDRLDEKRRASSMHGRMKKFFLCVVTLPITIVVMIKTFLAV